MKTVFSKILSGKAPASFVYRDDVVAAFMDIRPVNMGHVLVVPVKPAAHLADVDDVTAARMMVVARRIAEAIRMSGLKCEGVNLFLADGVAAGQEVFHVHLHVYPRFAGDGFGFRYDERHFQFPSRAELDEVARRIAATLEKTI
jgi:histidine triad (HIT) family protein